MSVSVKTPYKDKSCHIKDIDNPCDDAENFGIIVHNTKIKKLIKYKLYVYDKHQELTRALSNRKSKNIQPTQHSSETNVLGKHTATATHTRSSDTVIKETGEQSTSKYIGNPVSEYRTPQYFNSINKIPIKTKWQIYRCQLNTKEESCCCSCNSDAMFEVMKSLYDCYKMKDCNNCNCILCGHLPREERQLGAIKKSLVDMGMAAPIDKEKLDQAKAAGLLLPLEGKSPEEKERILRGLGMLGLPLPVGKTASDKKLIDKVRTELGLPPEPRSPSLREKYNKAVNDGAMIPLEGKTAAEQEQILKDFFSRGIPLPEGRTATEKALIAKVKKKPPVKGITSKKIHIAKEAGFLTPLHGKSSEQKEKIIKGLAMAGLPLPEAKTSSEKKLIDKVRADLGLPPEPKTPSLRQKYNDAANEGLLVPLEGKTPAEKEKILQGLADRGIPLPTGRTTSEKSLIAKVKAKRPKRIPSEKLRRAKAAGLLTPMEGKTSEQKEKIIRGLAMEGLPLPEAKTPSEKKLIDKVRADLGLPPEPKTPSLKQKYNDAANEGLLVPLEGKTPAEKGKILQGLADRGIPLPEGRTPSEKALIAKVKAKRPKRITSEKLRRAKAAGLLTPLEGKTSEQKEKIIKGLAMEGLPLPEAKTPSEKKLIDKVRADLGLSPEPKTPSLREKYARAAKEGIMVPLEGKTAAEKEKILQALTDKGLPLPQGRTPSEKALIAKVKAGARPPTEGSVTKQKKSKSLKPSGVFTPLEGKTPEQKEKILRGLAKRGLPLPESESPSEKKLIDKVRTDFGLPPEPRTPSTKQKYANAQAAGLVKALEGKTPAEKEKILRGLVDMGVPLPEGRTPSEKAMIAGIKGTPQLKGQPGITTEKIRKVKAAGLLTPVQGKSADQKEKIFRGLAKTGFPLPEGKTASEKALIRKVKSEYGIPVESLSQRLRKAQAAGILTPLSGKTPAQQEKILRSMAAAGLPLPEGETPSEKALIKKVKADSGYVTPTKSEKMRKAKVAGLLTPLKGKTPSTKEKLIKAKLAEGLLLPEDATLSEKELIKTIGEGKTTSKRLKQAKAAGLLTPLQGKTAEQKKIILKELAKAGLPLPEPKSTSERSIANKIRDELGLPPEPRSPSLKEKFQKASATGIVTPLEGKTPAQKERILKKMQDAGIPLPKGRTTSEKALIKKIQDSQPTISLAGKSPEERAIIMKDLAMKGLPLPDTKTASDKSIAKKVRKDLGLPPKSKSPSEKQRYDNAQAAGLIEPLEGKTPAEKEKILRKLASIGVPLPEGRTSSEKSLITKVKAESRTPIPSEKWRKAKAASILTPIEGKTPTEKEKIIKSLVEAGLPLPEGKTASDKSIIQKLKTELGMPSVTVLPSDREVVRKAKADGLVTPLTGKTLAEKEKILKGRAKAGLPLPEGKTISEKALIKKVRTAIGLGPEPTPSEKAGKIRRISRRVGGVTKGMDLTKSKAGIAEELEEIVKSTKCDRACGCDKKKIRFKHSYVKIRVTSPDISSLCPCPNECIPGVKAGVFTDNEGIKVTIGSVVGVPSYSRDIGLDSIETNVKSSLDTGDIRIVSLHGNDFFNSTSIQAEKLPSITNRQKFTVKNVANRKKFEYILKYNINCNSDESLTDYTAKNYKTIASSHDLTSCVDINKWPVWVNKSENGILKSSISSKEFTAISLISQDDSTSGTYSGSSYSLLIVLKTESSLKLSTSGSFSAISESITTFSIESNDSLDSCRYLSYYPEPNIRKNTRIEDLERLLHGVDYEAVDTMTSDSNQEMKSTSENELVHGKNLPESMILRISRTKLNNKVEIYNTEIVKNITKPIVVVNNLNGYQDIMTAIDDIISKRLISDASIFVVVPSTDDDAAGSSENLESTIGLQISEDSLTKATSVTPMTVATSVGCGISIQHDNKHYKVAARSVPRPDDRSHQPPHIFDKHARKHKRCQVYVPMRVAEQRDRHITSTDTTQDRPCFCQPRQSEHPVERYDASDNCVTDALSELLITQGVVQGLICGEFLVPERSFPAQSPVKVTSHQSFGTLIKICSVPPCSGYSDCHHSPRPSSCPMAPAQPPTCPMAPAQPPTSPKAPAKRRTCPKAPTKRHTGPITPAQSPTCPIAPAKPPTCPRGGSHPCQCSPSNKSTHNQSRQRGKHHRTQTAPDPHRCANQNSNTGHQCNGQFPNAQPKKNADTNTDACELPMCPYHIELRKMRSDMTQTSSGFKLSVHKCGQEQVKTALPNKCGPAGVQVDLCGHRPKVDVGCEYPTPPPSPPPSLAEEPFGGLKFRMNGKQNCGVPCQKHKQC